MTNLEIAKFISEFTDKNLNKAIVFFKDDLKIEGLIIHKYTNQFGIRLNKVSYNSRSLKEDYAYNEAEVFSQDLLGMLDKENIERIKTIIICMQERKSGSVKDINTNNSQIHITNIANATANAININNIETLSELNSYIENNPNIENKTEIKNIIKDLEKAKDNEDHKSYLEKFIMLLEILEKLSAVPPVVSSGFKFVKKIFDKK